MIIKNFLLSLTHRFTAHDAYMLMLLAGYDVSFWEVDSEADCLVDEGYFYISGFTLFGEAIYER